MDSSFLAELPQEKQTEIIKENPHAIQSKP